ncbi:cobalt ABC transporter ATP-binding domain protein [Mycobacterium xenopi 3993]|nr:cobalt ABC transporter ATP-binding domain protein [Mycobacterium xenopi 3993]
MVDHRGRDALLGILSGLTKRHRTALVHITHYNNEAASADRVINLSDTRTTPTWSKPRQRRWQYPGR